MYGCAGCTLHSCRNDPSHRLQYAYTTFMAVLGRPAKSQHQRRQGRLEHSKGTSVICRGAAMIGWAVGWPYVMVRCGQWRERSQWPKLECWPEGLSVHETLLGASRDAGVVEGLAMSVTIKKNGRASLVAQWLGIRLPMQGTRVRALVGEDPTCCGATKLACHNYWALVPQLLRPTRLEPVLHNKRSHCNEKPTRRNEEWPLLATAKESPHTATKTQHSQK